MNCDGFVDSGDCTVMALAMTDPDGYAAAYPSCTVGNTDLSDGDGLIAVSTFPCSSRQMKQDQARLRFDRLSPATGRDLHGRQRTGRGLRSGRVLQRTSTTCLVVWQADARPHRRSGGASSESTTSPWADRSRSRTRRRSDRTRGSNTTRCQPVPRRVEVRLRSRPGGHRRLRARSSPSPAGPGKPPFPVRTTVDQQLFPRLAYAPGPTSPLVISTNDDFTDPYRIVGPRFSPTAPASPAET